jgi:ribonuclease G
VALIAAAQLQELHIVRATDASITGNIVMGKVLRVLPGMQAAFVEVGLARPGFLHARDVYDSESAAERTTATGDDGAPPAVPDIRKLLHAGQILCVQIAKDPLGGKGARLTTHLAIASRSLVLTPHSDHIGISLRIDDELERERLRELVVDCAQRLSMPVDHGFIVRTAAQGMTASAAELDMHLLADLWRRIASEPQRQAGQIIYEELPIQLRVLRDLVNSHTESIEIDDRPTFERAERFMQQVLPDYVDCLSFYCPAPGSAVSLFAAHGIEAEIEASLNSRVRLASGGYLVLEQTEAMITVDVNTGSFTGSTSLEDTVFQTNLEAAAALPRQLRLRNLGGIVVIDFIDMEQSEHREAVVALLREHCAGDPARINIIGMSDLGLVELSRKRTRESLYQQLCDPCDQCNGTGLTKKPETTSIEIMRAVAAGAGAGAGEDKAEGHSECELLVQASAAVVDRLLGQDAANLARVAQQARRSIRLQVAPDFGPGCYDLVLVGAASRQP